MAENTYENVLIPRDLGDGTVLWRGEVCTMARETTEHGYHIWVLTPVKEATP